MNQESINTFILHFQGSFTDLTALNMETAKFFSAVASSLPDHEETPLCDPQFSSSKPH